MRDRATRPNRAPAPPSPAARRFARIALAVGMAAALSGCPSGDPRGPGRVVQGHHSLEDIGEMAFAEGERAEDRRAWRDAFDAYARAEWAFELHRRYTGREPELLASARAACDRAQSYAAARPGQPRGGGAAAR